MADFIDEARIFIKSGKGGDGMMHFRREKYVPRGGPDGGDGGKGGDVVFVGNPKINTLQRVSQKVHFVADDGTNGGTSQRTGAKGEDCLIEVPLGTIIREASTGRVLADINQADQRVIVLNGGKGGRGNIHWKSSRNQAPQIAEKGDPSQELWLNLELKLLADVGIVGMPNAGKSTLLSVISNAKPKIADYPFTTLTPNLGVVRVGYEEYIAADIPGLIEGAAQGLGLGHDFLRHVQRTRLLVHLVDGASASPHLDFQQINSELSLFDEKLGERPQLVVVTKLDLPEAQAQYATLEERFSSLGYPVMGISAVIQQNTQTLASKVLQMLNELPPVEFTAFSEEEKPLYRLEDDPNAFTITKQPDGSFLVQGQGIERAVSKTIWYTDDAVRRFQQILESTGISKALEKAGVEVGDTVFIGEMELEWGEG
jgi:GTP-binding protein